MSILLIDQQNGHLASKSCKSAGGGWLAGRRLAGWLLARENRILQLKILISESLNPTESC
jgi:hypothetical protein